MAKIVVTGGAGFIGTNLIEELLPVYQVIVVDNLSTGKKSNLLNGVKFYQLDVTCPEFFEVIAVEQPEYIVHLAAQVSVAGSVNNPLFDLQSNIWGTLNIIEAARRYQVKRVIYPSSAAVYGNPVFLPITEEHPINPLSPYGVSKHTPEHYFQAYFENYGVNYSVLRLANVYGPRQDSQGEGGVLAVFTDRLLNHKPIQIFGDGEQTRDFVFVKDVAGAIIKTLDTSESRIYNIGSGQRTSINELFRQLRLMTQVNVEPEYLSARPGDIPHSVFDISNAKNSLAWEPQFTLMAGMTKTIQWFKESKPKG